MKQRLVIALLISIVSVTNGLQTSEQSALEIDEIPADEIFIEGLEDWHPAMGHDEFL